MDTIINFLSPYFNPYFVDALWLILGIAVLTLLFFFWTYRVLIKIDKQKGQGALLLQVLTRICKRAKFVREGKRAGESKELYKSFMAELEIGGGLRPIVIIDGKPRAIKMSEYDRIAGTKEKWVFSPMLFILSVAYAIMVFLANGRTIGPAFTITLVLPILQILMYFVLHGIRERKNKFRIALFNNLKEASIDFFRLTKPYILSRAFPDKIKLDDETLQPKKKAPFFIDGTPSDGIIREAIEFFEKQKAREMKDIKPAEPEVKQEIKKVQPEEPKPAELAEPESAAPEPMLAVKQEKIDIMPILEELPDYESFEPVVSIAEPKLPGLPVKMVVSLGVEEIEEPELVAERVETVQMGAAISAETETASKEKPPAEAVAVNPEPVTAAEPERIEIKPEPPAPLDLKTKESIMAILDAPEMVSAKEAEQVKAESETDGKEQSSGGTSDIDTSSIEKEYAELKKLSSEPAATAAEPDINNITESELENKIAGASENDFGPTLTAPVTPAEVQEIRSGEAFDMLAKMARYRAKIKGEKEFSVDSIGDALEEEIAKRKKIG